MGFHKTGGYGGHRMAQASRSGVFGDCQLCFESIHSFGRRNGR